MSLIFIKKVLKSFVNTDHFLVATMRVAILCTIALHTSAGYSQEEYPDPSKKPIDPNNNPKSFEKSGNYVHDWEAVKPLSGDRVGVGGKLDFTPRKGFLSVIVFLAPWNEPSQNMMKDLKKLENKYSKLETEFVYVFAHTTPEDAEGFFRHFKISRAMMATDQSLKTYIVDNLPTIYVGDKHGWLTRLYSEVKRKDLLSLDSYLKKQTAF